MEIYFPRYENGYKCYDPFNNRGTTIKDTDYNYDIKNHQDFYDKILKNITKIDELMLMLEQIKNKKMIDVFKDRQVSLRQHIDINLREIPDEIKGIYTEKATELKASLKKNICEIQIFLHTNIDDTEKIIDKRITEIKDRLKAMRKISDDKYYLKQKELTGEELEKKKQARKISANKYYLKQKELTEEELEKKKEARKISDHKYYLKQKELTGEELEKKKEARKLANKKYYMKKKELLDSGDNVISL